MHMFTDGQIENCIPTIQQVQQKKKKKKNTA